ncbi:MAG: helix-turn-helix domain-containing protein [Pseudomonadota bacterium]
MQRPFSQYAPAKYLLEILDVAKKQVGVSSGLLDEARALGKQEVGVPEGFISLQNLALACDIAIRSCDDPWLGLKLGKRMSPARFGAIGAAASSCQRAIDMIRLMESFSDTLLPIPSELQISGEYAVVEYGIPPLFEDQLAFHSQATIAANFRMLEDAVGYVPNNIIVALPFRPAQDYSEQLACRTESGAAALSITYPLSYLQSPLLSSDPAARKLFLRACEDIALQLRSSQTLGASIQNMLANCQNRYPSLEQIAGRLNVTSRTLRNRLAREGLSYRRLVRAQRVSRAKQMLDPGKLSVADIAEALGYTNSASFCRAFKCETGLTPASFRAHKH